MWTSGTLMFDGVEYAWEAKVYDRPSPFGIRGGRISKLFVMRRNDLHEVMSYDRCWDKRPRGVPGLLKAVTAAALAAEIA